MNNFMVTFRSHANEKHLNDDFLSLITPTLNKCEKYVVGEDEKGTLAAHYHIVFPWKGDITHAQRIFNNKPWKNFRSILKDKMTDWQSAFHVQKVKNDPSDHDLLYSLGYALKGTLIKQKGFTNEYLKQACDYYYINARKSKAKPDKTWKIINTRTAHAVIEDFCERTNTSIHDEDIILKLNDEKIYLDISIKTQDRILASLRHFHRVSAPKPSQILHEAHYLKYGDVWDEESAKLKLVDHTLIQPKSTMTFSEYAKIIN